ncbi:hypothetical protein AIOL_001467 [Candidatus Rhodobacter oscarellae]|uniref:Uncharacterized protein n=1 Tax=Candidatus Rhodobacter oscarellae TaxID=1675527 RepID=A0A0J9GSM7_9RHOB|nr:hypothetical protein [Candidatus Rhodobacter lobularis]KMW56513.1 hypothetical protein AIOL_001467 [Candidatus Rhodobacter lobularis]
MRHLAILFAVLAAPANAGMSAEEFEAYVTGQTLTYAESGVTYGIEEYLPNRRVRWSFIGDECQEGYWYEASGEICFVYEHNPDTPQCWIFTQEAGRLTARFMGASDGRELYAAERSSEPLRCLGPEVGV